MSETLRWIKSILSALATLGLIAVLASVMVAIGFWTSVTIICGLSILAGFTYTFYDTVYKE